MFKWVLVGLFCLFWLSGITKIEPDEVALVLRLGKLHGAQSGDQMKGPGLLAALPYPIDRVIKLPVKREGEVLIDGLWSAMNERNSSASIDPIREGYCLTGDENIVQPLVMVKYRISDPVAFVFWKADSVIDKIGSSSEHPAGLIRDTVMASLTQTISSWSVDDTLRLQHHERGQESLAAAVLRSSQSRLDAVSAGVTIAALEFKEIHPPSFVVADFQRVQSARIDRETLRREAEGFVAQRTLEVESEKNRLVMEALAYDSRLNAKATAESATFAKLFSEFQNSPELIWQRLRLECIEQVLTNAGNLDVVAPGTRIIFSRRENGS
jgi:membrane protease subunit HflK